MFIPRKLADGRTCCSNAAALCDKCKDHSATARAASLPPDGYAAKVRREVTARDLTPDLDPAYAPFGEPADGYAIHRALQEVRAEEAMNTPTARAAAARSGLVVFTNGVPDGYKTALAKEPR